MEKKESYRSLEGSAVVWYGVHSDAVSMIKGSAYNNVEMTM